MCVSCSYRLPCVAPSARSHVAFIRVDHIASRDPGDSGFYEKPIVIGCLDPGVLLRNVQLARPWLISNKRK